jgi:hypothetical protein
MPRIAFHFCFMIASQKTGSLRLYAPLHLMHSFIIFALDLSKALNKLKRLQMYLSGFDPSMFLKNYR